MMRRDQDQQRGHQALLDGAKSELGPHASGADPCVPVGLASRWDDDFGDGWEHEVEAIDEPSAAAGYPVCLDGAQACPSEDCGDVSGYDDLRAVLADPTHEDDEHLSGWAPPGFDADRFDLVDANRRLRARR